MHALAWGMSVLVWGVNVLMWGCVHVSVRCACASVGWRVLVCRDARLSVSVGCVCTSLCLCVHILCTA